MPNKTIYVAEDHLPLFERAQRLAGGNLSAAIARAVRRFVESEEQDVAVTEKIVLTVGASGEQMPKQFTGRKLCAWRAPAAVSRKQSDTSVDVFTVYRTGRGQFAVHRRRALAFLLKFTPEMQQRWSDPRTWADPEGFWNEHTEAELSVHPDLDRLAESVPGDLVHQVQRALSEQAVEVLDI